MARRRRTVMETNTESEQGGIDDILTPREQRSFSRFLKRTLGKGFRLSFAQVHTPVARQRIVEWVHHVLAAESVSFYEVDLASFPGENLWVELQQHLSWQEPPEKGVIFLRGLENAKGSSEDRPPVIQQLNVQRDIFVRDFPITWVLFLHPYTRHRMLQVAPDFCDFATPWLQGREKKLKVKSMTLREAYVRDEMNDPKGVFLASEDLKEAWRFLGNWELDQARDRLAQYDLGPSPEKPWQRDFVWFVYLSKRGHTADALTGLKSLAEDSQLTKKDQELAEKQIRLLETQTNDLVLYGGADGTMDFHRIEQTIAEEVGDHATLAASYGNQALILRDWGNLEEALALHKKEQAIKEKLGNRASLAISFWNQGTLLAQQGDRESSLSLLKQAITIRSELGIPNDDLEEWVADYEAGGIVSN